MHFKTIIKAVKPVNNFVVSDCLGNFMYSSKHTEMTSQVKIFGGHIQLLMKLLIQK